MDYRNSTLSERNKLVKQYEPLVNKITSQFHSRGLMAWDDIKSMAYEGFVIAINTYDSKKSKMTFTQFAAFAIRNNILTSIDNELRTVKMSAYAQKKANESGEAVFNSVSMSALTGSYADGLTGKDNERMSKEYRYGLYEGARWETGNAYEYLYYRLENSFNERDCQIFYMSFGLKDYEDMKGKEIAKYFGISEGLVSQKVKKMINFIKKDGELREMMANL